MPVNPWGANHNLYNDPMVDHAHEIRVCEACGLRYPLVEGHPFGTRCPACMGETTVWIRRLPVRELKRVETKTEMGMKWTVLLDNIRSAWNVGSILRSADGFGFSHAFLCGITPTGDNEAVTKTALGAENTVPWSYHKDAVRLVEGLQKEGWRVYALEEDRRAVSLGSLSSSSPGEDGDVNAVLLLGNEVSGVDPGLLELCDEVLYIPMRGEKKSFNVAIAFGIAAYALTKDSL